MRLVLLVTSPRVAAGLLSAPAWVALHAGPVFAADRDSPLAAALAAAGVSVTPVDLDQGVDVTARQLLGEAAEAGTATWLVATDGDHDLRRCLTAENLSTPNEGDPIQVELMHGSWDLPGARLLDVVTTMDRLRSPGGCPWDAKQDHETLGPYLLEEAYEAFQAIEDADSAALREELGDVLLQVAFHARLAEELAESERWSIDDVATGLVDKLVRRHPHVFADTVVDGVEDVNRNWERIKADERGDASVVANVPLAAPALTLAATLQRKAARAGLEVERRDSLAAAAKRFDDAPSAEAAGELLWAAVTTMRALDIDAEAALRSRARLFRDEINSADVPARGA
jgi:XTP/dITP diphosphohydrolase